MKALDPSRVATLVIALYGGRDATLAAMERQVAEFNSVWVQDTDRIGRILRAHLAVEHFMGRHLLAANPKLAGIEEARLSYAQKIALLDSSDPLIGALLPGLKMLGTIRNRVAHTLRLELTSKDEAVFLSVGFFRALRDAMSSDVGTAPSKSTAERTLTVLEDFAKFAATMLHSAISPDAEIWKRALQMGESEGNV